MIFFSVVIPVYNRAQLLCETIDTVLSQTYTHFELIIVDDGSTDNTGETIKEKYGCDVRIRYYYKENGERGAARNYGIKNANGDYVVIFDSDDYMHADYLSLLQEKLIKDSTINFIATKYQLKEDSGKITGGGSFTFKEGFYNYKCLLQGNCFGCMYAIKKSNPQLKLFPEDRKYATLEDWIFILDNLRYDHLYLIDRVAISVRHNDSRSTADNQRVIKVRDLAKEWILENVSLTDSEKQELRAWSHYYRSIHYYLDHNRKESFNEAVKAIKIGGFNKNFTLMLMKSIIGRKIITMIR